MNKTRISAHSTLLAATLCPLAYSQPMLEEVVVTATTRAEALKGRQSTLLGKNIIAGAIKISTAGPSDEFEGEVYASWEPAFDGWSTTLSEGRYARPNTPTDCCTRSV